MEVTGAKPSQVVFVNSQIHGQINYKAWADWDNVSTTAKQFFREYNNTGEGSINSETATRLFLTEEEYKSIYSSPQKILGFKPKMPY